MHQGFDDTVCKDDWPCQWNTPILDSRGSKIPKTVDIKLDMGDYIGDITLQANFGVSIFTGVGFWIR